MDDTKEKLKSNSGLLYRCLDTTKNVHVIFMEIFCYKVLLIYYAMFKNVHHRQLYNPLLQDKHYIRP